MKVTQADWDAAVYAITANRTQCVEERETTYRNGKFVGTSTTHKTVCGIADAKVLTDPLTGDQYKVTEYIHAVYSDTLPSGEVETSQQTTVRGYRMQKGKPDAKRRNYPELVAFKP